MRGREGTRRGSGRGVRDVRRPGGGCGHDHGDHGTGGPRIGSSRFPATGRSLGAQGFARYGAHRDRSRTRERGLPHPPCAGVGAGVRRHGDGAPRRCGAERPTPPRRRGPHAPGRRHRRRRRPGRTRRRRLGRAPDPARAADAGPARRRGGPHDLVHRTRVALGGAHDRAPHDRRCSHRHRDVVGASRSGVGSSGSSARRVRRALHRVDRGSRGDGPPGARARGARCRLRVGRRLVAAVRGSRCARSRQQRRHVVGDRAGVRSGRVDEWHRTPRRRRARRGRVPRSGRC